MHWLQIEAMQSVFQETQYPDGPVLEFLGEKLGIPPAKIGVRFLLQIISLQVILSWFNI